jgi:hypothetical protein
MVHDEGGRTITVTYGSYETVDGIRLENEIRRMPGGVVRFRKTVFNAPAEASLFTPDSSSGPR